MMQRHRSANLEYGTGKRGMRVSACFPPPHFGRRAEASAA